MLIQPVRGASRPWYSRRGFLQQPWKGRLTVRSWPRHRERKPTRFQQQQRRLFRTIVKASKQQHPREQVPTMDAITAVDAKNRGFKASASLRFRDWEVQRLYLRLFILVLPDGTKLYPASVYHDTCDILDWIMRLTSGPAMRRSKGWAPPAVDADTSYIYAPAESDEYR